MILNLKQSRISYQPMSVTTVSPINVLTALTGRNLKILRLISLEMSIKSNAKFYDI